MYPLPIIINNSIKNKIIVCVYILNDKMVSIIYIYIYICVCVCVCVCVFYVKYIY